jgi:hypothetical protein
MGASDKSAREREIEGQKLGGTIAAFDAAVAIFR